MYSVPSPAKIGAILVAQGVNLDLLGRREPHLYGQLTLREIEMQIKQRLVEFSRILDCSTPELRFFQSNDEAEFLGILSSQSWSGILINAGAWTHTSLAIADRLRGLNIPFVEVHLTHLRAREDYRQHSYLAPYALGVVEGFGVNSYLAGLWALLAYLSTVP